MSMAQSRALPTLSPKCLLPTGPCFSLGSRGSHPATARIKRELFSGCAMTWVGLSSAGARRDPVLEELVSMKS